MSLSILSLNMKLKYVHTPLKAYKYEIFCPRAFIVGWPLLKRKGKKREKSNG
jgi:hypothetical protein